MSGPDVSSQHALCLSFPFESQEKLCLSKARKNLNSDAPQLQARRIPLAALLSQKSFLLPLLPHFLSFILSYFPLRGTFTSLFGGTWSLLPFSTHALPCPFFCPPSAPVLLHHWCRRLERSRSDTFLPFACHLGGGSTVTPPPPLALSLPSTPPSFPSRR